MHGIKIPPIFFRDISPGMTASAGSGERERERSRDGGEREEEI